MNDVPLKCPECGTALELAADDSGGQTATCKECGATFDFEGLYCEAPELDSLTSGASGA